MPKCPASQGNRYSVIGVMESKGSISGQDADDIIYLPLTNMFAEIVGNKYTPAAP
jgi:putative ABC transport system permease protein